MSYSAETEARNWEIFLWALYLLGGTETFVDVEDVFIMCFEKAPNRFSWRTKKDIPDTKKCSKGLVDAEAKRPSLMIKTRDGHSRQLTVEGQQWIDENYKRLSNLLDTGRIVQEPTHRPQARFLADLERSPEFQGWLNNKNIPEEKWRIADLFRCSPDSDTHIWNSRLEVMRSAAHTSGKHHILEFLEEIVKTHPGWFIKGE